MTALTTRANSKGRSHARSSSRVVALILEKSSASRAAEEATTIRRQLAQTNPAARLPDLATSLSNLGDRPAKLSCHDEALAPT
jgi:hypothetical protein